MSNVTETPSLSLNSTWSDYNTTYYVWTNSSLTSTAEYNSTIVSNITISNDTRDRVFYHTENVVANNSNTTVLDDRLLSEPVGVYEKTSIEIAYSLTTESIILQSLTTTEEMVERTRSGIPISLLWVPYLIFSFVLLSFLIMSFVRFHQKNGHKYRRRRVELWRQLNMQSMIDQLQNQVVGASTSPPNGGVNMAPPRSASPHKEHRKSKPQPSTSKSKSKSSGGRKPRRPLVFTSNTNGSMVDVRCGENNSLRTFHSKNSLYPSPAGVWVLPQKKHGLFSSGRSQTEPEADEVFLLNQTRL